MRLTINSFVTLKVSIALAMTGFGIYQIGLTDDEYFVAAEASLLEAYSKTYTVYSQQRHRTKTRYYFQYQYTFAGKDYTSGRYTHVHPGSSLGVERFKGAEIGTKFKVYVNPDHPGYAVIRKGQPWFIYVLTITGLFGLLNCWIEQGFDRLHTSNLGNRKQRIEEARRSLIMTGAATALGILVTLAMYVFSI